MESSFLWIIIIEKIRASKHKALKCQKHHLINQLFFLTSLGFSLGLSTFFALGRSGGALGISTAFLPLTAREVRDDLLELDWVLAFLLSVPLLMVPCLAILGLRLLKSFLLRLGYGKAFLSPPDKKQIEQRKTTA